jgi:hypothetical protein
MRVRIVKQPAVASIDGIQLGYFVVGVQYELGTTLAELLVTEGWAEPVVSISEDKHASSPRSPSPIAAAFDKKR